jgi:hypothetical protein
MDMDIDKEIRNHINPENLQKFDEAVEKVMQEISPIKAQLNKMISDLKAGGKGKTFEEGVDAGMALMASMLPTVTKATRAAIKKHLAPVLDEIEK